MECHHTTLTGSLLAVGFAVASLLSDPAAAVGCAEGDGCVVVAPQAVMKSITVAIHSVTKLLLFQLFIVDFAPLKLICYI
ncbi:hypothetical protein D3C73_1017560 [compost metagenome]